MFPSFGGVNEIKTSFDEKATSRSTYVAEDYKANSKYTRPPLKSTEVYSGSIIEQKDYFLLSPTVGFSFLTRLKSGFEFVVDATSFATNIALDKYKDGLVAINAPNLNFIQIT